MKVLIFGPGWLGHKFKDYFSADLSTADIANKREIERTFDSTRPDVVINAAGKTGRPNIDWCEDHKDETYYSNVIGPMVLAQSCFDRKIHMVHLSSGCVFNGPFPRPSGFNEKDKPNPVSYYSQTKVKADEFLKNYPVLILRVRMPIDNKPDPRNLITKLVNYRQIINVTNSITIIEDLLSTAHELINKEKTGIYNMVNPGPVNHNEILGWYKEIVDPSHQYEVITLEELYTRGLARAGRSNCILDTSKLSLDGIILKDASIRIKDCLRDYKSYLSGTV